MSEVAVDSGLNGLLCSAIQHRRLIRFRYKKLERVVEPHDYGIQKYFGYSRGRLPAKAAAGSLAGAGLM